MNRIQFITLAALLAGLPLASALALDGQAARNATDRPGGPTSRHDDYYLHGEASATRGTWLAGAYASGFNATHPLGRDPNRGGR